MSSGVQKIPRIVEGGVSLVSANLANQLIDILNSLLDGKVSPAGCGSFKFSKDQYELNLSQLDSRLRILEAQTSNVLSSRLNAVISSIGNSTINATCNANTSTITVTQSFPNLPNIS